MASLALVTLLTLHLAICGVKIHAEESRSFIDDIRDIPKRFGESLNGSNLGFDSIRENFKAVLDVPSNRLSDEGGSDAQDSIDVGGMSMPCFPGICRLSEVRSRPCEILDHCPEGYTLFETMCGCCNECVDNDFGMVGIRHDEENRF